MLAREEETKGARVRESEGQERTHAYMYVCIYKCRYRHVQRRRKLGSFNIGEVVVRTHTYNTQEREREKGRSRQVVARCLSPAFHPVALMRSLSLIFSLARSLRLAFPYHSRSIFFTCPCRLCFLPDFSRGRRRLCKRALWYHTAIVRAVVDRPRASSIPLTLGFIALSLLLVRSLQLVCVCVASFVRGDVF